MQSKIDVGEAPCVSMHANQLTGELDTVRGLVDQQFPEWARLPIRRVDSEEMVNAAAAATDVR